MCGVYLTPGCSLPRRRRFDPPPPHPSLSLSRTHACAFPLALQPMPDARDGARASCTLGALHPASQTPWLASSLDFDVRRGVPPSALHRRPCLQSHQPGLVFELGLLGVGSGSRKERAGYLPCHAHATPTCKPMPLASSPTTDTESRGCVGAVQCSAVPCSTVWHTRHGAVLLTQSYMCCDNKHIARCWCYLCCTRAVPCVTSTTHRVAASQGPCQHAVRGRWAPDVLHHVVCPHGCQQTQRRHTPCAGKYMYTVAACWHRNVWCVERIVPPRKNVPV